MMNGFVLSMIAIVFLPLLVIWSLNTLFPVLAIAYTLKTWFSVLVLNGFAHYVIAILIAQSMKR